MYYFCCTYTKSNGRTLHPVVYLDEREEGEPQSDDTRSNISEVPEQQSGQGEWTNGQQNGEQKDNEVNQKIVNADKQRICPSKPAPEHHIASSKAKRRRHSTPTVTCKDTGCSTTNRVSTSWTHLQQSVALAAAGRELLDRPLPAGTSSLWKGGRPDSDFDAHTTQRYTLPNIATFTYSEQHVHKHMTARCLHRASLS